jgi:hypothetical protein
MACLPMNASVINASIEVNCNGPYLGPLPLVNFTGAGTSDEYGLSVSSAGDINGDGYNDMIMGAPNNKTAGVSVGKAYIYFSSPTMDNNPDVILSYGSTKDEFGGAVSGAGDVNNDGFDDVIVGAKCNDSGGGDAGRAYIFFGGSSRSLVSVM